MIDFWANVQKTETCWNWNGPFDKDGYGRTHYNGNTSLVHRVSWILNKGAIPDGNQVLHHCDNPPCVNPDHLFLGNPKINAEDRVKKNRQAQGESLGLLMRGENHGKAKLTAKQVLEIRAKNKENVSIKELAREYKIHESNVSNILNRRRWGWLDGEPKN